MAAYKAAAQRSMTASREAATHRGLKRGPAGDGGGKGVGRAAGEGQHEDGDQGELHTTRGEGGSGNSVG
jgi:hypothetical protein